METGSWVKKRDKKERGREEREGNGVGCGKRSETVGAICIHYLLQVESTPLTNTDIIYESNESTNK